jgi:phage tail-like protein
MSETAARKDPYLAFRFEVMFNALSVAGFSDCTGLQTEIEVQDYPEGGWNVALRKLPGRTKQGNLTLKRGVVDLEMWNWYYDMTQGRRMYRDCTVRVRDEAGKEAVIEWQLQSAFPCKWLGPDLSATQNQIAVETVEICHQGLKRLK